MPFERGEAFVVVAALGDEEFAHHDVVGNVLPYLVPEPSAVGAAALLSGFVVAGAVHISKAHGPDVGALGALQKHVN